ncbi:hypothetical protein F5H01DRAFT_72892 [Linnemannia elongata]|nr:hypothetical protein F5H01DRAFT_72892 [Linnemannia elongata]
MYKLLLLLALSFVCSAQYDCSEAFGLTPFYCVQDCCKKVGGNLVQNHSPGGRHVDICNAGGITSAQFTQCCRDMAPQCGPRDGGGGDYDDECGDCY